MAKEVKGTLIIEDKDIVKDRYGRTLRNRNFAGEINDYNERGVKQFSVELQPEFAEAAIEEGWPVSRKLQVDRDTNESYPRYFLKIVLKYHIEPKLAKAFDPIVHFFTEDGVEQLLGQEDIPVLDKNTTNIVKTNLQLRPWNYDVRGHKGVQAQLDIGYFYLGAPLEVDDPIERRDPFASKR